MLLHAHGKGPTSPKASYHVPAIPAFEFSNKLN